VEGLSSLGFPSSALLSSIRTLEPQGPISVCVHMKDGGHRIPSPKVASMPQLSDSGDEQSANISQAGRSDPMSRKTIGTVLVLYFIVALAFSLFIEWGDPLRIIGSNAAFVGRVAGVTASYFLLPAIIPMIVWAFRRLRTDR